METTSIEIAHEGWSAGVSHVDGRLSIPWLRHLGIDRLGPEGCPLVAPWFGRLDRHGYEVLGRTVTLEDQDPRLDHDAEGRPLHGLRTLASDWVIERAGATTVTATTAALASPAFPFPHEMRITVQLSGAGLTLTTVLEAGREGPVPVGFGWHPYLVAGDDPVELWDVDLPFVEQAILHDLLPTASTRRVVPTATRVGPRDDCFLVEPGATARVVGPTTTTSIDLTEGYRWAMVWSPGNAGFICVEPMAGPLLALRDDSGGPVVPPGGRHSATFTLG